MKRLTMVIFSISLFYLACNEESGKIRESPKGGRVYGGTFKINETERIYSIFPLSITDAGTANIAIQIYEGLVKFNPKTLEIQPSVAESWEVDESGTRYTFHIKKGIKFHDDPCFSGGEGRELTAKDIKYSFELMCTQMIDNLIFSSTLKNILLGASRYFEASVTGKPSFELEGVKVIDDYTIQLVLEQPNSSFLYILTHAGLSIIAQEAYEQYGNLLKNGTGPFVFASNIKKESNKYILTRNNNYHAFDTLGNQLPFLDSIEISFVNSKKEELDMFYKGKLDIVHGLPPESIKDIIEEHIAMFQSKTPQVILYRSPEMSTNYYFFNLTRDIFKDKRVRQALNYAVDKNKILNEVLNGEASGIGKYGINPSAFKMKGYDITKIEGFSFDPIKANKLLAEAGYPDGKNFPTLKLELNSGGNNNTTVALAIQKQFMDYLNINVDIEIVPFLKKLEDERYGRSDIFRAAWIADYPSPESFLLMFYGKYVPSSLAEPSYPNSARYINPAFDELYEKGVNAKTQEESYEYFLQAEQLMIEDAPVIVLWYNEHYILTQAKIKNFFNNPMKYSVCSEVYIDDNQEQVNQLNN